MKKVVSVKPIEGKKVEVVFSDGICGIFDVAPYISSDISNDLKTRIILSKSVCFSMV